MLIVVNQVKEDKLLKNSLDDQQKTLLDISKKLEQISAAINILDKKTGHILAGQHFDRIARIEVGVKLLSTAIVYDGGDKKLMLHNALLSLQQGFQEIFNETKYYLSVEKRPKVFWDKLWAFLGVDKPQIDYLDSIKEHMPLILENLNSLFQTASNICVAHSQIDSKIPYDAQEIKDLKKFLEISTSFARKAQLSPEIIIEENIERLTEDLDTQLQKIPSSNLVKTNETFENIAFNENDYLRQKQKIAVTNAATGLVTGFLELLKNHPWIPMILVIIYFKKSFFNYFTKLYERLPRRLRTLLEALAKILKKILDVIFGKYINNLVLHRSKTNGRPSIEDDMIEKHIINDI